MKRSLYCLGLLAVSLSLAAAQSSQDKKAEANMLAKKAEAVTKKIGELASTGKLPTSDEGIELLRKLVDELSEIKDRLKALEGDMKTVKGAQWPSKTTISGYLQFQYRDTNQVGGQ
ncbi:MAG TPA: hypothetical protein VK934_05640, partial [Fimbriimonas sp.]|nr:hypothetical protein [Fimbriimonas sp.]